MTYFIRISTNEQTWINTKERTTTKHPSYPKKKKKKKEKFLALFFFFFFFNFFFPFLFQKTKRSTKNKNQPLKIFWMVWCSFEFLPPSAPMCWKPFSRNSVKTVIVTRHPSSFSRTNSTVRQSWRCRLKSVMTRGAKVCVYKTTHWLCKVYLCNDLIELRSLFKHFPHVLTNTHTNELHNTNT